MHIDKDLTQLAVIILSGPEIHALTSDLHLLSITGSAKGKLLTTCHIFMNDLLCGINDPFMLRRGTLLLLELLLIQFIKDITHGVQRLAELGTVTIERIGLDHQLPREQIRLLDILDCRFVRQVDRFGDGSGDERLCCCHHPDVPLSGDVACSDTSTPVGTVKDRKMLILQMGSSLHSHGSADIVIRLLYLALAEPEMLQHIELIVGELLFCYTEHLFAELLAQCPLVECKLDIKASRQRLFNGCKLLISKPSLPERLRIDRRAAIQGSGTLRIADDLFDLSRSVSQLEIGRASCRE